MTKVNPREGKKWPAYILGGRLRTSTLVLIIAFIGVGWLYETYEPKTAVPEQVPASEVVPPGFIPDPAYTWAPRTDVQPRDPSTSTTPTTPTTPTTTSTTPTTPTTSVTVTPTTSNTPAESGAPTPSAPSPSPAEPTPSATESGPTTPAAAGGGASAPVPPPQ